MNASIWGTHPASGEWNTAANWNPADVPKSTATFETSSQTAIIFSSKSAATVNKIEFADGAPSYTFTFSSPATSKSALTIAGEGVFNSSRNIQSFVVASFSADGTEPQLKFTKSATAGGPNLSYSAGPASWNGVGGGVIGFHHKSTAGSASFVVTTGAGSPTGNSTVGGEVSFHDSSSAGTARFIIYGTTSKTDGYTFGNTVFHDTSTADHATFTSVGGTVSVEKDGKVSGGDGGNTQFFENSTAAYGNFNNYGGTHNYANGGDVAFDGFANGGHGKFYNHAATITGAHGGVTSFNNNPDYAFPAEVTQGASAGNGFYHNYGARESGQGEGGHTEFTAVYGSPTAANASFINHGSEVSSSDPKSAGYTVFSIKLPTDYRPTAGNGIFWNLPGSVDGAPGGFTEFEYSPYGKGTGSNGGKVPTAGDGTFHNQGGYTSGAKGGYTSFSDYSSADNAQLIAYGGTNGGEGGYTSFSDYSSADNAQLIAYGGTNGGEGGRIAFYDESSGGAANVQLFGNGVLDISYHTNGLTIGVLDLTGGTIKTQLGTNLTGLTLSEGLILNSALATFYFWAGAGFKDNTPYTILTAPNLHSFKADQFSGNSLEHVQPTFTIVDNTLRVSFNR